MREAADEAWHTVDAHRSTNSISEADIVAFQDMPDSTSILFTRTRLKHQNDLNDVGLSSTIKAANIGVKP